MSPARRAAVAANKPPHLRAVLWDLDGTLTDSVRLVVDTMNFVIAAHGGPLLPYEKVGELTGLTGVDDPYEPPINPELVVPTHTQTLEESVEAVWQALHS